jgi:hypothetical protein
LIVLLLHASNSIERQIVARNRTSAARNRGHDSNTLPGSTRRGRIAGIEFKHGSAREWLVASEQGPPAMKNANSSLAVVIPSSPVRSIGLAGARDKHDK